MPDYGNLMLSEKKRRRLNVFRYGLLVVTCVAFALDATLVFIGSGKLWMSVLHGALFGIGTGLFCIILYYLYRSYLIRSP